jgi:hypothetical protein
MAERKSFLLRIDAAVLEAAQRWANDDLRSVNAQIEFVLREALKRASRIPQPPAAPRGGPGTERRRPKRLPADGWGSATESSPSGPPTGD